MTTITKQPKMIWVYSTYDEGHPDEWKYIEAYHQKKKDANINYVHHVYYHQDILETAKKEGGHMTHHINVCEPCQICGGTDTTIDTIDKHWEVYTLRHRCEIPGANPLPSCIIKMRDRNLEALQARWKNFSENK